ncbi:MAG: PAS domain-containing sensor histidine kinase [Treponema sp.]|jgi:two-component system phosphate regulon sensor histidine kinase PhoR|nr:PAS domain-containing sensor histidine kinase [Treponema sp.]
MKKFFRSIFRSDVSVLKKANAELQELVKELAAKAKAAEDEELKLSVIFNSLFEGVVALDNELKVTLANPRICSLLDYASEKDYCDDVCGMPLLSFSRSMELEAAARQVLETGKPCELTIRRYVAGIEQHLRAFAAPLEKTLNETHGKYKPQGVVIVLADIGQLVKLEQVRKDFAANVSHELRTPLQVAKGYLENLLESKLDDKNEIRRFVEIINKNILTMENLTNDLLTLVSLEAEGAAQPAMEEASIAALIEQAVSMVEMQAKKKNITIESSCDDNLSAKLYGQLIIQALVNLLDNGIKYSGDRSVLRVNAFRNDDQIIIVVKDEGQGIPAEHMGRIFERFYRGDRSRNRETKGTGLGLSIVRRIALLHKGNIEVESHAGEGSVFRLRLPC